MVEEDALNDGFGRRWQETQLDVAKFGTAVASELEFVGLDYQLPFRDLFD